MVHDGPRTMIVLEGSSAVGKTTVARYLARQHGVTIVDTDAIKRAMGLTHAQVLEHTEMEVNHAWFVEAEGQYKCG